MPIRSRGLVNEEKRACLLLLRVLCSETGSRKCMFSSLFPPGAPEQMPDGSRPFSFQFPLFLSQPILPRKDFCKAGRLLQTHPVDAAKT